MKYLLVGDNYKRLFIENDQRSCSYSYNKKEDIWEPEGSYLNDCRYGYDPSEPEGSPYRYGNYSCMKEIVIITKQEAESFIGKPIDENKLIELLKE